MIKIRFSTLSDIDISWNAFVSYSGWHQIAGVYGSCPAAIANKVWIAHGAGVCKGATKFPGRIGPEKGLVTSVVDVKRVPIAGWLAKVAHGPVELKR